MLETAILMMDEKMYKSSLLKILAISLVLFPLTSSASGWVTSNKSGRISFINPEGGVVRIHVTANDIRNPDQCGNASTVMLKGDSKNTDRQYALLLAAFMAKKPVKLWVSGCENGWGTTYPRLTAVYVYD